MLPLQQIGQKYYQDGDRSEIFYQKIDETGYAEVSFEGASVCEFIQDIGFFHFPSRENHDDKGSERHEPAGGQLVEEVEHDFREGHFVGDDRAVGGDEAEVLLYAALFLAELEHVAHEFRGDVDVHAHIGFVQGLDLGTVRELGRVVDGEGFPVGGVHLVDDGRGRGDEFHLKFPLPGRHCGAQPGSVRKAAAIHIFIDFPDIYSPPLISICLDILYSVPSGNTATALSMPDFPGT